MKGQHDGCYVSPALPEECKLRAISSSAMFLKEEVGSTLAGLKKSLKTGVCRTRICPSFVVTPSCLYALTVKFCMAASGLTKTCFALVEPRRWATAASEFRVDIGNGV
jgi:hypothetical protein